MSETLKLVFLSWVSMGFGFIFGRMWESMTNWKPDDDHDDNNMGV